MCKRVLDSITVSIPACHAGDPGSIPGRGASLFILPLPALSFLPSLSCCWCPRVPLVLLLPSLVWSTAMQLMMRDGASVLDLDIFTCSTTRASGRHSLADGVGEVDDHPPAHRHSLE